MTSPNPREEGQAVAKFTAEQDAQAIVITLNACGREWESFVVERLLAAFASMRARAERAEDGRAECERQYQAAIAQVAVEMDRAEQAERERDEARETLGRCLDEETIRANDLARELADAERELAEARKVLAEARDLVWSDEFPELAADMDRLITPTPSTAGERA